MWLTQKQMAELFGVGSNTITYHLKRIFKSKELNQSTTREIRVVQKEGKRDVIRSVDHYNLDAIISVGYRVDSDRANKFRIWATQVLKSYMMNGFAINEVRIKVIEDKLDNLSTSLRSELKTEIKEINRALLQIANRPINISNQINLTSDKLEEKIINLIDQIIENLKDHKEAKTQLEKIKSDIKKSPHNSKAKNRIISFFKEIGDDKSDIYKIIKGEGVTKNIISQLVKLGVKLKDLL